MDLRWSWRTSPLTSFEEPSLSHNTDFIHDGAEDCLGWEGALEKPVQSV